MRDRHALDMSWRALAIMKQVVIQRRLNRSLLAQTMVIGLIDLVNHINASGSDGAKLLKKWTTAINERIVTIATMACPTPKVAC